MGFNTKKGKKFKLFPFKMPTAITILFLLVFLVIVISWIPGTTQKWTDDQGISHGGPLGFLDLFNAPIQGFASNAEVIIFVLVIGGYLGIVMKSKALDAGIGRLVKRLNGKEIWIIPTIMIILSIGGTVEGMCEETIPYYLIIIPALLAAGFDVVTGVLVILLGAGVGVMFSTLNPFAIATASAASGVETGDGVIWRLVCWIIGTAATIGFVTWYAIKVKRNPEKSVVYHLQAEHHDEFLNTEALPEFTKKRKIILSLFGATFLVMILCIIPWGALIYGDNNAGIFKDINEWLKAHFPYITGTIPAFGNWTIITLAFLFFFASIVIALIDWKGEANYIKDFVGGSSELLGVAVVIAVASGIGWTLKESGMQNVVLNGLSGTIAGMPKTALIIIGFFMFLVLAFFIPSTSGLANAAFPIISQLVASVGLKTGMITAFAMASGWINLFAPSAGIMMAGLAIAKVPLTSFYKSIWPYAIGMTLFCISMLAIGSLLPNSIF